MWRRLFARETLHGCVDFVRVHVRAREFFLGSPLWRALCLCRSTCPTFFTSRAVLVARGFVQIMGVARTWEDLDTPLASGGDARVALGQASCRDIADARSCLRVGHTSHDMPEAAYGMRLS